MQKFSGKIVWLTGWVILFGCTFTMALEPNPTATLEVPTSTSTATITVTPTASPTILPSTATPTSWNFPVTPITLDPSSKPKGNIAFEKGTYNEDGIYQVAANAQKRGALKYIYTTGSDPVWSADGKRIAINAYRIAPISEYPGDVEQAKKVESDVFVDEIAVLNSDGTHFTQLTHMQAGDRLWEFVWSPDGQWIAVVRSFTEYAAGGLWHSNPTVYIIPTDGSGTMKKIGDTANIDSHIEWFPDSKHLAFLDPGGLLVIASIDTGEQITMDLIDTPTDNYRIFDLSPDGKYIAYLEYSSTDYSIKVADLEGGSEDGDIQGILLFHDALEDNGSYVPIVGGLSFSPDGARLLFVHSEKGIATLRLFSSGAVSPIVLAQLTDCTKSEETTGPQTNVACWSPNWKPGWSSDGQWIVYATAISGRGWENGDIYILNVYQAVTGSIKPILQAEHGRKPYWQPAG